MKKNFLKNVEKKVEDLDLKDCSFYFGRKMMSSSVEK